MRGVAARPDNGLRKDVKVAKKKKAELSVAEKQRISCEGSLKAAVKTLATMEEYLDKCVEANRCMIHDV